MISILAANFAYEKHKGQKRKYTGEPYINHCLEVVALVACVTSDKSMISAAFLHDTVEDCGVTFKEIQELFGEDIAKLVCFLTDVSKLSDGNRKLRKEIDRKHIEKACPRAKTIKLADIISNTKDILENDPKFSKIYLEENKLLLDVLKEGNNILWKKAYNYIYKKTP